MNTSEHYKLYIDARGAFILANHAGYIFLGYEPRDAAEAVFIDKCLEVVEVCPDGSDMNGEIPCLVRYKVTDAEAVKL